MKINFYLKNPTQNKENNKESLISIFCSVYGKRLVFSTRTSIPPDKWDSAKQQAKKSYQFSVELNGYLDSLKDKIRKAFLNDKANNPDHSLDSIKEIIQSIVSINQKSEKIDFFEAFDKFISAKESLNDYKTIQKYKTTLSHLKNFQTSKKYQISFDSINSDFFEKIQTYFIKDLQLTNNTIEKHIKTLSGFLNWCIEKEYTQNTNHQKFKYKREKTVTIYLTMVEFKRLLDLDLSQKPHYDKTRDIFCFQCLTGQRISDIQALKRDDIKKTTSTNEKGQVVEEHYWQLVSKKTKDHIKIPLIQQALDILTKYPEEKRPLPFLVEQKINEYLKEVCKLAKIDEVINRTRYRGAERIDDNKPKYEFISTHVARKTFITLCIENGMSPTEIMSISGHTDLKTMQKYLGHNEKIVKEKMNKVFD
jgi:integrase